jgi:hypothetical protein
VVPVAPNEAPANSWFRWRTLQWGAAAACVVIVGAAVLFNTGTQKKEVMPYATSDQPKLAAERQASSQVSSEPVLRDRLTAKNEQNAPPQYVRTSRSKASDLTSDLKRKESAPSAPPARELDHSTADSGRISGFIANGDKLQSSDARALREKVEDSAVAQGISKDGNIQAQEKVAANAPVPSACGKDRSGVRDADKAERRSNSEAAQVAGAPEESKSGVGAAKAVPSKQDTNTRAGLGAGIAPSSEAVEVSSENGTVSVVRSDEAQFGQAPAKKSLLAQRWKVTPDGAVLRSLDAGRNWKTAAIDRNVQFLAIATSGNAVWAGGKAGTLYRSTDAGEHWTRVIPNDGATTLAADITRIELDDGDHAVIRADQRAGQNERWTTLDGGKTWTQQ